MILGTLTSGSKAWNEALLIGLLVNHTWRPERAGWCDGGWHVGMKRCSFRPVTTALVCQGYTDGLMKRSKCRCEGLEVQGTLTKIMLYDQSWLLKSYWWIQKWSSSSTSLSISRILMLSLISPLEASRWIYYGRKKTTNSWKMICALPSKSTTAIFKAEWLSVFLRVIFCFTSRTNGTGKV